MAEHVVESLGDLGRGSRRPARAAAPPTVAAARFGSRLRIQKMSPPEATKLIASAMTASGAPNRPTMPAAERLAEDLGGRRADLELRVALDELVAARGSAGR